MANRWYENGRRDARKSYARDYRVFGSAGQTVRVMTVEERRDYDHAAETTWHAEDFKPAPEKPAPLDPWAAELAT